jgi:hypothetical protein
MKRSFACTHYENGGSSSTPRLQKQARQSGGGGGGSSGFKNGGRGSNSKGPTKQLSLRAFLTVPTPQTKVRLSGDVWAWLGCGRERVKGILLLFSTCP